MLGTIVLMFALSELGMIKTDSCPKWLFPRGYDMCSSFVIVGELGCLMVVALGCALFQVGWDVYGLKMAVTAHGCGDSPTNAYIFMAIYITGIFVHGLGIKLKNQADAASE